MELSTILKVLAALAVVSAVVVFFTGRDVFYRVPISGEYRLRASLLWALGGLILWILSSVI